MGSTPKAAEDMEKVSEPAETPANDWEFGSGNDTEEDRLRVDPLLAAVKEAKWSILERFSKVTKFSRETTAQILDHPLGRPLIPFLPPKIAALASSAPARSVMDEFEGARLYLAKWAAGVAARSKKEQEKEERVDGSMRIFEGEDVWDEVTTDAAGLGVWEVLSLDDALPVPESTRTSQPVSPEDWLTFYDLDGRLTKSEAEIREMVFRGGVENDIRPDVWKYFLGFWPWSASEMERLKIKAEKVAAYDVLKGKWKSRSPVADEHFVEQRHRIEKDVVRTDRTVPFFSGDETTSEFAHIVDGGPERETEQADSSSALPPLNANLVVLKEILLTYNYHNTELGYVQGMSDLLAPIYAIMRDEVEAFWCFVGFMNRMEPNFLRDQSGMRTQLATLEAMIKFMDMPLYRHLEQADSLNLFCCFRWLLVWFKREFDFDKILRLWEVLFSDHHTPDFHLFVALAVLEAHRDVLVDHLRTFDEILKYVNDLSGTIDLEETLGRAEVLFLTFRRRWEKAQRVVQAAREESEWRENHEDKEAGSGEPLLSAAESSSDARTAGRAVPALDPLLCKLVNRFVAPIPATPKLSHRPRAMV